MTDEITPEVIVFSEGFVAEYGYYLFWFGCLELGTVVLLF